MKMVVCNKHKWAHWELPCPTCLSATLDQEIRASLAAEEKAREPHPCERCGNYGAKIVTFTGLAGHQRPIWICPTCLDRDLDELKELRKKVKDTEEFWENLKETFEEWGI